MKTTSERKDNQKKKKTSTKLKMKQKSNLSHFKTPEASPSHPKDAFQTIPQLSIDHIIVLCKLHNFSWLEDGG